MSGRPISRSDPLTPPTLPVLVVRRLSRCALSLATRTSVPVGFETKSTTPSSNAFCASILPCRRVWTTHGMSFPHGCRRASREQRQPVVRAEIDLADDEVDLPLRHHLRRLLGGARDLHLEALLDHAELEHRRLLRIGVDEERDVAVGQEARLQVLAHHDVVEEIDEVGIEDRALVLRQHVARLARARAPCGTGCAGSA